MRDSNTVEPPNKGHFEANSFEELSLSQRLKSIAWRVSACTGL